MKKQFKFSRAYSVEDMTAGEDPNVISFSLASANPYLREDSHGKKFYEILEISEEAIDFTRLVDNRAPLLFSHDPERQLGAITKAWIENGKLMVTAKFSSNSFPQSILRDIQDGLRKNVSVGYQILDFVMVKENDYEHPVMLVKHWLPLEGSIVSIPADEQVGIGRALESVDDELSALESAPEASRCAQNEESKECDKTSEEEKSCDPASSEEETKEDEPANEAPADEDDKEGSTKAPEEAPEAEEEATKELDPEEDDEEDKARLAEIEEIRSLGDLTNQRELAESFIKENLSLDQFKTEIKNLKNTDNNTLKENIPTMEEKFNLLKAIRGYTSKADANFVDSYEFKVNEDNKRAYGITDADIVLTPAQLRAFDGTETLNQVVNRPDLYTGVLRPESVLAKTGARIVAVDGQSISFSVATSGVNAGWVDINGNVPSATMDFALKQLNPKKAGAFVDISFQSLLQDDPSAQAIVMDDIVKALAQVLDEGAIKGSGSDGEPTGITATAGVNTVPVSGAFTLSGVYGMEAAIRESYDYSNNLKFVCNTKNYYRYATTPYSAVEQNRMLLENGKMIGHDVVICNALDDDTIILGNFDELVMANFKGITLKVVEDATLARKQALEIVAHAAVDFVCRRPKSFTKTVA